MKTELRFMTTNFQAVHNTNEALKLYLLNNIKSGNKTTENETDSNLSS